MEDILTVTLNPALDFATATAAVRPGPKLRCSSPVIDPGGGGVNVSRAIRNLGGRSRAFMLLGGATGEDLLSLLQAEGVEAEAMTISGRTRISLAVHDEGLRDQYRFVLPGPEITQAESGEAAERVAALAGSGIVVLSGSLPPGMGADFPAELAARLAGAGAKLFVDTSGPALRHLTGPARAGVHLLRLNGTEAEEIAGRPLGGVADAGEFCAGLVEAGAARTVVLGCGPQGSLLVTAGQRLFCAAPSVPIRSKTGAGDSFLGAFALRMAHGESLETALRHGVAAASAAVMTEATKLCDAAEAERQLEGCRVSSL